MRTGFESSPFRSAGILVNGTLRSSGACAPRKPDAPAAEPASEAGGYTVPTRVPFWKRAIFSLLWLPDDRQGFIGPAVRAARSLLRRGDIVYTTAPPFSMHLVGLRLGLGKDLLGR